MPYLVHWHLTLVEDWHCDVGDTISGCGSATHRRDDEIISSKTNRQDNSF